MLLLQTSLWVFERDHPLMSRVSAVQTRHLHGDATEQLHHWTKTAVLHGNTVDA